MLLTLILNRCFRSVKNKSDQNRSAWRNDVRAAQASRPIALNDARAHTRFPL